eukprot:15410883-Alexandrium_andersonii.AAC.1
MATQAWVSRACARIDGLPAQPGISLDPVVWGKAASGEFSCVVSRTIANGLRLQARLAKVWQASQECPFCGHAKEDARRRIWECPRFEVERRRPWASWLMRSAPCQPSSLSGACLLPRVSLSVGGGLCYVFDPIFRCPY